MVMEGRIRVISRHMVFQESRSSDSYEENSKNIWTYAHILMYVGLRSISAYICKKGIKSHVQLIMNVFRDDLGNIKGTKIVHGVQRVSRGIEKAIKV